jgi:hypothetical protein
MARDLLLGWPDWHINGVSLAASIAMLALFALFAARLAGGLASGRLAAAR